MAFNLLGLLVFPFGYVRAMFRLWTLIRAIKRHRKGRYARALRLYGKFVAYSNSTWGVLLPLAYEQMAECYAKLGDLEGARNAMRRARESEALEEERKKRQNKHRNELTGDGD
ncbi:MAG TPA: hypothetical protein PLO37_25450 [Candidatus Hydrogenedentes bacterium]|nr:hypothetical protein [Candidatus Hydrogenedentota bacterium]HPG70204.1 hypothetical protein [Candidatus Hydrogenedentota bacterium]